MTATEPHAMTEYRAYAPVSIPTDGYGVHEFVPRPELVELMSEHRWLRRRMLKHVRALRMLATMRATVEARWALEIFWSQESVPFLRSIHDWSVDRIDRYPGASQATAALKNVHQNARVALDAHVRETDWHRHDIRLETDHDD